MVLQGGLFTSLLAGQKQHSRRDQSILVVVFLLAKLLTHFIFGLILGFFGSWLIPSLTVSLIFQTMVAIFMLITALNLLGVSCFCFPNWHLPRFAQNISSLNTHNSLMRPIILGSITILIPCGVTQSMELLAIGTGNALQGGLVMIVYVLGTIPLFLALGLIASSMMESWYRKSLKIAALVLIALALYSLNGVLLVLDSPVNLSGFLEPIINNHTVEVEKAKILPVENLQLVRIKIDSRGYNPSYVRVKKDVPVELTLESKNAYSCALSFILREFNLSVTLKPNDRKVINFTPQEAGKFRFSCSMGMYTGILEVVD